METYAGIAHGNIKSVLYRRLSLKPLAFNAKAIKNDRTTCRTIFVTVHKSVKPTAERKPESSFRSARP